MGSNLSDNPTSIQTDLSTILGDQVPSYNLVARWVACFKEVQEDVEYKGRNYRFIQANIEFFRSLIEGNPISTYYDIEAEMGISQNTINHLANDCLTMRKITSMLISIF